MIPISALGTRLPNKLCTYFLAGSILIDGTMNTEVEASIVPSRKVSDSELSCTYWSPSSSLPNAIEQHKEGPSAPPRARQMHYVCHNDVVTTMLVLRRGESHRRSDTQNLTRFHRKSTARRNARESIGRNTSPIAVRLSSPPLSSVNLPQIQAKLTESTLRCSTPSSPVSSKPATSIPTNPSAQALPTPSSTPPTLEPPQPASPTAPLQTSSSSASLSQRPRWGPKSGGHPPHPPRFAQRCSGGFAARDTSSQT